MIKCPFCHYENEDGALFCERCSSDLSGVASSIVAEAPSPVAEPDPFFGTPPPTPAEPVNPFVFSEPVAEPVAEPYTGTESVPFGESVTEPEPLHTPPPPLPQPPLVPPVPVSEAEPAAPEQPEPVAPAPAPEPEPAAPVLHTPEPAPAPAPTPEPASLLPLGTIPPGAEPKLQVLRGQRRNAEYPIYEGQNYIGRADEKPVDIDLEEQEPPDRIWCSRQHAVITFEGSSLTIEDLNSANGTYVNRARVYPGQQKPLAINDIVQIGNVQLKVII
jgi:hypothetical protein